MSPAVADPLVAAQPTLPVSVLVEFGYPPRSHWGDMAGLTENVRTNGVIEPLIVRPIGGGYQVIAGRRRLRAARAAELDAVPVCVREDLTEQTARDLALIENIHRNDLHPLDEARAYAQLRDEGASVAAIAGRVGKDEGYIFKRLKLEALIGDAEDAFAKDQITLAHAERLARLTPEQQSIALESCFLPLFSGDEREAAPVSQLDRWIAGHTKADVFSDEARHYFPELMAEVEATDAGTLIELSESAKPAKDLGTRKDAPLARSRWVPIVSKKDRCEHVQRGVVVHGGDARVLEVCATKTCTKHFPETAKPSTSRSASSPRVSQEDAASAAKKYEEERAAGGRRAERANMTIRLIVEAVATRSGKVDLGLLAQAMYSRLGNTPRYQAALKQAGLPRFAKLAPAAQARVLTLLAYAIDGTLSPYYYGGEKSMPVPSDLLKRAKALKVDVKAIEAEARTQVPEPGESKPEKPAAKKTGKKR